MGRGKPKKRPFPTQKPGKKACRGKTRRGGFFCGESEAGITGKGKEGGPLHWGGGGGDNLSETRHAPHKLKRKRTNEKGLGRRTVGKNRPEGKATPGKPCNIRYFSMGRGNRSKRKS